MKKIKGSVKAIHADAAIIIFCIGIILACPIRIYQSLVLIEADTGFYSSTDNLSIIALYAVLGIAAILILLFSYLSRDIPAAVTPRGRSIPLALVSLILSAGLVTDIFNQIDNINELADGVAVNVYGNIFEYLSATDTYIYAFQIVFAALSCLYFIFFGLSYIIGTPIYKHLSLLALCPLIWDIMRIFTRITTKISFIQISDLLLEIIGIAFMMIFFFMLARVASEINCEGSMWSLFSCGIIAALVTITYSLPRLILVITGNSDMIPSNTSFELVDLCASLFIIVFIIIVLRGGYTVEDGSKLVRLENGADPVTVFSSSALEQEDSGVKKKKKKSKTQETPASEIAENAVDTAVEFPSDATENIIQTE